MHDLGRILCVALLALLAALAAVRAQDPETGGEAASEEQTSGSVTIEAQAVDGRNESSKLQEYREVPNGFYLGQFDFAWAKKDWSIDLEAVDLMQDDERIKASFGRYGKFRIELGYDQTPKWFSNTARTLFTESDEGNLILPPPMRDDLQALGSPAAGPQLARYLVGAHPVDLRYRRDTATVAAEWTVKNRVTLGGSYSNERRDGVRPLTLATYFSAGDITEFAAPVDFTTETGAVRLEYAGRRWHLGGELGVSHFSNDGTGSADGTTFDNAVVVDNPLRATDANAGSAANAAAARFLYALPPDNVATFFDLTAGARVGAWGKVAAHVSFGRSEQDEQFLPFSLNSAVPAPSDPRGLVVLRGNLTDGVPVSRYDGKVNTGVYDLRFSGNPLGWLGFKVFTRSYDYDNRTPEYTVTDYIRGDTGLEGIPRAALPFAWKKDNHGADVRFRPLERLGVSVGYEQERWDREFRNTRESTEDIFKAAVDWTPAGWWTVHASARTGERTYDAYDEETFFGEESFPEGEPVVNAVVLEQRLFDLANRDQLRLDLNAEITPNEHLGFGVSFSDTRNEYDDRTLVDEAGTPEVRDVLGRLEDQTIGWAVDLYFNANESITLYADYGIERFESDVASRYRPVTAGAAVDLSENNWLSDIEDTTKLYGVGVNAQLVPDRWTLDVHALVSDGKGRSDATFVPGGAAAGDAQDFPEVSNRLSQASVDLRFKPRKALTLGLGYVYEEFEIDDFYRDVMQPWMGGVDSGTAESAFLGWRIPSYDVNLFRVLVNYRF